MQALVWDYTPIVPPTPETDQTFYKKEQPATAKGTLQLQLDHLRDGNYRLAIYAIGYGKNDAYTAYLHMGAPSQITRGQVADLNAASKGEPESIGEIQVRHGTFSHDSPPAHERCVYLIVLTPAQDVKASPKKDSR